MKGEVFRLGHMGYVGDFDVITALAALEQVLQELGASRRLRRRRSARPRRSSPSAERDARCCCSVTPRPTGTGSAASRAGAIVRSPPSGGGRRSRRRGSWPARRWPRSGRARSRARGRPPPSSRPRTGSRCSEAEAFKEMGFGEWEGLTRDEVAARFPDALRAWARDAARGRVARRARRSTRCGARVLAGLDGAARAHAGADGLSRLPRDHRPRADPGGPRARPRPPLVAPARRRPASRSSSSATDWTTLHRMNSLVHLDRGAATP